jgi:predicted PurR-regulated permease PerM
MGVLVLRPFLAPIAWAAILAYASWPVFGAIEGLVGGRRTLAAAIMTVLMVLLVMVPAALISVALAAEVQSAYGWLRQNLASGPDSLVVTIGGLVRAVPWIGPYLADRLNELLADPAVIERLVLARLGGWAGTIGSLAAGVGRGLFEAILILLTLFVFYRHGRGLIEQLERGARRLGGERMSAMLVPLGETVRAVTYGTLFTALAQGGLVMVAAWAVGLGAPVLIGAATGILAFTPFGPPLVYVPAAIWLAAVEGRYVAAGFLLAWGLVVVSSVDNVIRTWFLSGAARIPFLLGLFGLLGGVAAFGVIGLFVGPVAVALLLTLWREWTDPVADRSRLRVG